MPFPHLVRECGGAVMLGAAIGALSFAVAGFQIAQRLGATGGALVGAVVGAFSGLDAVLPVPRRRVSDTRGRGMGPFRAGALYAFAATALLGLSIHLSGSLRLECLRDAVGVRCSRVTVGWLNQAETSRTEYGGIAKAYEGGSNQIVVATADEQRYVIEGFDAAAVNRLAAFIPSDEPTFVVHSDVLKHLPMLLWIVAAPVGALSVWSFRTGVAQLRVTLRGAR